VLIGSSEESAKQNRRKTGGEPATENAGRKMLFVGSHHRPWAARLPSASAKCLRARPRAAQRTRPVTAQRSPLYPEPEPYQSEESSEPSAPPPPPAVPDAQVESAPALGEPEIDLKRAASSFWRVPWATWWLQLAFSLVGGVILVFALGFPGVGPKTGASAAGLVTTAVAAIFAYICLFWTFGYTRLGLQMAQQLDAVEMFGKTMPASKGVRPVSARRVYYAIRFGVIAASVGLLVALFGLQSITGILLAKVLTQGFSGPYTYNRPQDPGAALGGVQPIDIFVIQACANIMLSLFTSLMCSLWLTTRYRKREKNA